MKTVGIQWAGHTVHTQGRPVLQLYNHTRYSKANAGRGHNTTSFLFEMEGNAIT